MTKMKLFFLLILVWGGKLAEAADHLEFDGEIYTLQEVVQTPSIPDGYRNVYVPEGEGPTTWRKMIVLQSYPNQKNPDEAIIKIRTRYPISPAAVPGDYTTSKHGKIFPLVLLNANNGKPMYESNLIRFETIDSGLVSFQYIERFPIPNMERTDEVLKTIESGRDELVQILKKIDIPAITKETK